VILLSQYYCQTSWKLESVTSQIFAGMMVFLIFNEFSGAQLFGFVISKGVLELSRNHVTNM
jgi:hypothetical protein